MFEAGDNSPWQCGSQRSCFSGNKNPKISSVGPKLTGSFRWWFSQGTRKLWILVGCPRGPLAGMRCPRCSRRLQHLKCSRCSLVLTHGMGNLHSNVHGFGKSINPLLPGQEGLLPVWRPRRNSGWCFQRQWSQTSASHCLKRQAECIDPFLDNCHFSSLCLFMLAIQIECLLFS